MVEAWALVGGGARGIFQPGAIKALLDQGRRYDRLYGTSVGALNGSLLHSGQIDEMINLWMTVRNSDVYTWAPWKAFGPEACLFDTAPLRRTLRKHLDLRRLRADSRPFAINMCDMVHWSSSRVLASACSDKQLLDALMASSAAPVAFPRVRNSVDGGLVNNFSIAEAHRDGADSLVIIAPTVPQFREPRNLLDIIGLLIEIPAYGYLIRELSMLPPDMPVTFIQPPTDSGIGLLDFDMAGRDRKKLIDNGYRVAQAAKTMRASALVDSLSKVSSTAP